VGYDAARALITALQEPGGTERARLRDFLAAGSFSSTTGPLRFDAQRTAVRSIVVLKVGVARFDLHDVVQPDKARTATP
jgi:ABC-type branched-subunit amino acid transport system substrate-binding protein